LAAFDAWLAGEAVATTAPKAKVHWRGTRRCRGSPRWQGCAWRRLLTIGT